MQSLAIVGTGPMATYVLKHTVDCGAEVAITLFERDGKVGTGMPYRPGMNAPYMLCNAFSREIPPPTRSLLSWLEDQPAEVLEKWGLTTDDINARTFYPRVLIGEYLASEQRALIEKAKAAGYTVNLCAQCEVIDIRPADDTFEVEFTTARGSEILRFDFVIIATGHEWPDVPRVDNVGLLSPWPCTNVTNLPAVEIGVLGSSLSAIDVVVALGHAHGSFDEIGGTVRWLPNSADCPITITMVSHQGIMPEGDFYYPFPYEPLHCLTPKAIAAEIDKGENGLLDRTFALLCAELDDADPEYLASLPGTARTVEGFAPAYFHRRRELGGLIAVERDFDRARELMRDKQVVAYRYALLRGHEQFDGILRHLSRDDYARFEQHLLPVFADCYAAVPHLSLARVLALYRAGILHLTATEAGALFDQDVRGRVSVETVDGFLSFDVMVDARGQASATVQELPFAGLTNALQHQSSVTAPFRLDVQGNGSGSIYCLAMPQLLERQPFSQGLVECSKLARQAVEDLAIFVSAAGKQTGIRT